LVSTGFCFVHGFSLFVWWFLQVYLTIYGDASNSGQLLLGEPDNGLFQAESTEKFEVRINSRIERINGDHCF
jgi:hypothetical protein